jgi:hypothetical protein
MQGPESQPAFRAHLLRRAGVLGCDPNILVIRIIKGLGSLPPAAYVTRKNTPNSVLKPMIQNSANLRFLCNCRPWLAANATTGCGA